MALVDYGLSPEYEQVVCWLCCTRPEFWKRIGYELKPGGFAAPEAQQLLLGLRDYIDNGGQPPSSWLTVREWMMKLVHDGSVDPKEWRNIRLFTEEGNQLVEDAGVSVDDAVSIVAPPVREEHTRLYIEAMVDSFGKGRPLEVSATKLQQLKKLGVAKEDMGLSLEHGVKSLGAQRLRRRLPTDHIELDTLLRPGIKSGTQTVVVGGPGDGKSMFLSQLASHGCSLGLNVAVATLEVSEEMWLSRVYAGLLRIPEDMISSGQKDVLATVGKKLGAMLPTLGNLDVRYFTPQATTVTEVLQWAEAKERAWGSPVDLMIVDYADKLLPDSQKDASSYTSMRDVYEKLRIWSEERDNWSLTASQSKSRGTKDRGKRRDVDDAADSMHKSRVCDLMLTLNTEEAEDGSREVSVFIAKNRYGKSRSATVSTPTDFEYGRLTAP